MASSFFWHLGHNMHECLRLLLMIGHGQVNRQTWDTTITLITVRAGLMIVHTMGTPGDSPERSFCGTSLSFHAVLIVFSLRFHSMPSSDIYCCMHTDIHRHFLADLVMR